MTKTLLSLLLFLPIVVNGRSGWGNNKPGDVGGNKLSSTAQVLGEDLLSLVDDKSGFLSISGPVWGQNLFTGEHQFQLEASPVLPNVRNNCSER
jgi:hypothetical protein